MKPKEEIKNNLEEAKEIIDNMIYAIDNDKEFPLNSDFAELAKAEQCLSNCGSVFLKIYKP